MKPRNEKQKALFPKNWKTLDETQVRQALFAALNFDPRKAFDGEGNLLPLEMWPADLAFAVAGFEVQDIYEYTRDGKNKIGEIKKVRWIDRGQVLALAMRYFGMLQADKEPARDARDITAISDAELAAELDAERQALDEQRAAVDARKRALEERLPKEPLRLVARGSSAA